MSILLDVTELVACRGAVAGLDVSFGPGIVPHGHDMMATSNLQLNFTLLSSGSMSLFISIWTTLTPVVHTRTPASTPLRIGPDFTSGSHHHYCASVMK